MLQKCNSYCTARLQVLGWLVALSLAVVAAGDGSLPAVPRKLLIRDIPAEHCDNTVSGRWLITDDTGTTCSRDLVNPDTGCCTQGDQFSCNTCSSDDDCCEEFEYCVACCLAPKNNATAMVTSVFRGVDKEETGRWASPFEYCRNKCRTHSRSTVHENSYLAVDHYCFSLSGKPRTPAPPTPPLAAGVQVLVGEQGKSCAMVCQAASLQCAADQLAALNNCNVMREYVACEAGCQANSRADFPSYMVAAAPKPEQPTLCWTNDESKEAFSCDGMQEHTQRICPCIAAPVGGAHPVVPGLAGRPAANQE